VKLFDAVRNRFVAATPEERVRQGLLRSMIGPLGFPKGLIAVEYEFKETGRRADLVCFFYLERQLVPLLIVECKAEPCGRAAREQAFGYNAALRAPFVSIADPYEVTTFWLEGDQLKSVLFLPCYRELIQKNPYAKSSC
jgi:hypothetical protein